MPRDLRSWAKALVVFALSVLILSGCARRAPDLPPDYGSQSPELELSEELFADEDLALSCTAIADERSAIIAEAREMESIVEGNRTRNQAAGYFGLFFILPLGAAEVNEAEKARLDELQARWDQLAMLSRFKACPSEGST